MSTPFTSPYSEAGLQTLLDEITLAYSERRQAIGQTAYTPEDGRDVQAAAYWAALQNWIETYCTSFVDYVNGPLNETNDGFLKFTLETFRAAAGLHPDGFRRATEWDGESEPDWQYGTMQADDYIVPWTIEDLQKALSALRATVRGGGGIAEERIGNSGYMWEHEDDISCEAVFPYHDISWNASEWIEAVTPHWYWAEARKLSPVEWDTIAFQSKRHRGYPIIRDLPTTINCAADIYGQAYARRGWFYDIDGLGLEDGKLFFVQSLPESNQGERIGSLFGNYETSPLSLMGYSCPYPASSEVVQVRFLDSYWHLKWNFTNSGTEE